VTRHPLIGMEKTRESTNVTPSARPEEFQAFQDPAMDDENPYAPPKATLELNKGVTAEGELAGRWTRFCAAFLDAFIGLAYGIPIMWVLGIWGYLVRNEEPPRGLLIASNAFGFLFFVAVHGYFLYKNGQTVGKKLLGIRIADLDGNVPDLARLLLLRYLPVSLITLIPVVGNYLPLFDVLFILQANRRCLHDMIAGTIVVETNRSRR
jgi:uncharacterized RDD family membrane protein YckC